MPNQDFVKKKHLAKFNQRVLALGAVLDGASIQEASKANGVDRTTLASMVKAVAELAPDGKPFGYRVCIPWYRVTKSDTPQVEVPLASGASAFTQLLAALPELKALVCSFKGKLPSHNDPSAKFDVFFRKFVAFLKGKGLECHYPLNSADSGRRALQNWIKRERKVLLDIQVADNEDVAFALTRVDQIFKFQPLDRVELDGHITDVEWHAQVPTKDDKWTTELISGIWILAAIDVASLAAYPCTLVIGRAYDRYDLLEAFANTLRPWSPRDLIVPKLQYAPGAWMPTMAGGAADVHRPASVAIDNALAHKAKMSTENFGDHQLGVINLGFPHVPEGRPNIEAFFKRMEDAVLRHLAGGFRPSKERGAKKKAVSTKAAKNHPVDVEALRDLMDVEISAYNSTPHPSLQNRTPREVFESHIEDRIWTTQSFLTDEDAGELLVLHEKVTIRGDKRKGVLPYVKYQHARYRSSKLTHRYDLVGKTFRASIDTDSAHQMSLWDDDGNLFVVLRALRPWAIPHSLKQRSAILKCTKRGLLTIEGSDDALAAYHAFVRTKASDIQWAADAYVKEGLKQTQQAPTQTKPSLLDQLNSLSGLAPRAGRVDLRQRRKS
jgi:hypothetical protein